jgi:hypothetical protein
MMMEFKKPTKSSTAAQISGDSLLLKLTTSKQYPDNLSDTSYVFVFHWKEKVMQYEKLELEYPPEQKLRMLHNTVSDIADLANVKLLSDQMVIRLSHLKVTLSCSNQ